MQHTQLANNLKTLMTNKNIGTSALARATNIGQSVIFRILSGETNNPKIETLRPIANYFEVSISQLVGEQPLNLPTTPNINFVPLITLQQAPHWRDATTAPEISQYAITDAPISTEAFAIKTADSTMLPRFPIGATLIIDPNLNASDGNFVIAHQTGQTVATFKQLLIDGDDRYLKPLNKEFQTVQMTNDHTIIGTMVQVLITGTQ